MTEKLYWKEPYSRKFGGRIVKKEHWENGSKIVLDRTLFYPTSGGQLCDHGFINGIKVIDVIEDGEEIVHIVEGEPGENEVVGEIDWERRFDNMQQHTGQHILSQSFLNILGAETLSSNLGEEVSVIEISINRIDWNDIERVEDFANKVVHEDREVLTHIIEGEEWEKFPLRKPPPRQKKIRIVEIKGFDFSACGGTHLSKTGEVGLIKVIGWERIRGNIRVEFLCGKRGIKDYRRKYRILKNLSQSLTAGLDELCDSILRMKEELLSERKRAAKLEEKLVDFETKEILSSGEGILVTKIFEGIDLKNLRKIASRIISLKECIIIVGSKGEKGNLIIACTKGMPLDLKEFLGMAEEKLEGKGGGTKNFIQVGGKSELLEHAINEIEKGILKILSFEKLK